MRKAIGTLKDTANFEARSLREFVERVAGQVGNENELVLDVGAGKTPYRKYFNKARYLSTDLILLAGARLDFLSNAHLIPIKTASVDYVLSTQMLEHVTDPADVLIEFHRVLKTGGKVFLTVPLAWQLHQEPHHYYNFTPYSLRMLFERAGFQIDDIETRGGYFTFMANKIAFSSQVFKYYLSGPKRYVLYPFFAVYYLIFSIIIPIIIDLFDPLDKERKLTLGYSCVCTKI